MESHVIDLGGFDVDTDEESNVTEETDNLGIDSEQEFKVQLQDCLDEVKHEGTYSALRPYKQYTNPGLYIKDFGTVGLPLSTRDAVAIAGKCRKAPFGKGDETVIDEAVRRTWELDATEFGCGNPDWHTFLDTLAQQAIQDLGVQVSARAQPYKLLLYEEGAHFKAHRDTEKVPGMFGTLVVCLPSLHSGGSVHLSHGSKQRDMDTASASAFSLQTLAWYSDVQHEIRPVEKGYRLVLTYNFVQDQTLPMQTAAALDANHDRLATLLQLWNKNYGYLDYLVYPLDHKYSEASLSLRNLKGQDAAKGRFLDHLCANNGFYWFLTQMTKEEQYDYYDYCEDEEETLTFGKIMLPSGRHVHMGLYEVDETMILADQQALYDRNPDSEAEGEYTGNENMPSTHRYHNSVVVLMTKRRVLDAFRRQRNHSTEALIAFFDLIHGDRACESGIRDEAFQLVMEKALAQATSQEVDTGFWTFGFPVYGKQEREKKHEEYADVFETVASHCRDQNLGSIPSGILRKTKQERDWASSKCFVGLIAKQIAWETRTGKNDAWDDWFSQRVDAVPTYAYANELRGTLEDISKMLPSDSTVPFNQWGKARLEKIIGTVESAGLDDAQPIIDIIPHISPQIYFENIIRVLSSNVERQVLSRFMHLLATDYTISQEYIVRPTYQILAVTATSTLKLSATDITEPEPSLDLPQGGLYPSQTVRNGVCAVELLNIVDKYMKLGLENEATQLLDASLQELLTVTEKWSKWKHWFKFLGHLLEKLALKQNESLTRECKPFITNVLHSCATHMAHSQPKPPQNWIRTTNSPYDTCTCAGCTELNAFLASPTQRTGRFSYAEKMRKHLQYRLGTAFRTETEKRKSPYTLVVTKTNDEYERLAGQWREDVREMRNQLNVMQRSLKAVGVDAVETAGLDALLVRSGGSDSSRNAARRLQPSSASTQNLAASRRVAGVKRGQDLVDLTED